MAALLGGGGIANLDNAVIYFELTIFATHLAQARSLSDTAERRYRGLIWIVAGDPASGYRHGMLERSAGEWARICRRQAGATTDKATRESLMTMASRYEVDAASAPASLSALYYDQPPGAFEEGFVFDVPAELMRDFSRRAGPGYWRCDIAHGDRLSWSEEVYELFGLPAGTAVEREWAVDRYTPESRQRLARVRDHALRRGLGFMLDAEIDTAVGQRRWIRIFAVPVLDSAGRPVQLQGMKRQL